MKMNMLALFFALFLAGCVGGPYSASGAISAGTTADPMLAATIQADRYWRDAQGTTVAQQATLETNYQHIEATAQAGTATAVWQATSQAVSLRATEQSMAVTGTAQAIELAALAGAATSEAEASATAGVATIAAQGTSAAIQSTRQALEIARAESEAQREKVAAAATYGLAIGGAALFVALLGWLLWQAIPTLITRLGMVRYGQHDNPLLLLHRKGRTVVTDPLAMLQASTVVDEDAGVTMPEIVPGEVQTLLAGGRLGLLIEQARHAPGHLPQLPAEVTTRRQFGIMETTKTIRHGLSQFVNADQRGSEQLESASTPPLPSSINWGQLARWPGPGLALGAGRQNQIIAVDLARTPHLFSAGMSGAGKTRRLLRPLVAQALVGGYYAILMNESGADFSPFYDHPNATIIRGDAEEYMAVFVAAISEVERREERLRSTRSSEWQRLAPAQVGEQPPILLAIDELLALVMLLTPGEQRRFWGLLSAFASRARKVGMCSIGVATDPTYRALGQGGLNYRSQCARVSFRMMQAASSRAMLDEGGAETLAEGQFIALLDRPGVKHGVSANPSDEELQTYLTHSPAPALASPDWLDQGSHAEATPVDTREQQIRDLAAQGLSMRAVQQQVFGYVGGKAYDVVKPIYEEVRMVPGDITPGDTIILDQ